jgi:hypothetical protein
MAANTTARADAVAKIKAVLVARKALSPTLLRAIYNARPGSFPETPCAYISGRSETINYSAQVRQRVFTGLEVVLVDTLQDAIETEDRMDVLVDLLVDDFWNATPFYSGGGQVLLGSVTDADVVLTGPGDPVTYRGAVLSFGNPANPTFVSEGRP